MARFFIDGNEFAKKKDIINPNLLTGSKDFTGDWINETLVKQKDKYLDFTAIYVDWQWNGISQYIAVNKGETFTASAYFKAKAGSTTSWFIHLASDGEGGYKKADANPSSVTITATGDWQKTSITFTMLDSGAIKPRIEGGGSSPFWIAGMKLERGANATPWCPAYEDKVNVADMRKPANVVGIEEINAEQVNNEFTDRGVNVKWFGAKGDGVTDDTLSIQRAINTGRSVFLPPGKYNVTELNGFASGQIIQGISKVESWGNSDAQNITLLNGIGSADNYVIKNNVWENGILPHAITVKNLSIEGSKKTNGILVGNSSTIEGVRVHNCINGLSNLKVSNVMNCQITGCTNGVMNATDSRITNNFIYLNDVGINFEDSNDNSVVNNKIEWNGIGISITKAVYNLISNNIIDRSTTYGIYTANTTNTTITSNQFERNLTNHLYLVGSQFNISSNSFFRKNSKDDQSGEVVPDVAIFTKSIQNSSITNNFVNAKMFNSTGTDYFSQVNISDNTIDGINPDNIPINIPETTAVHGQDTKIIINLPSYLGGILNSPYNIEILSQRISGTPQNGGFYSNGGLIKEIYMSTSGIELTISNGLNDDLKITGTIYVRCAYSNLY